MIKYLLTKRTESQIDIFALQEDGTKKYETTCYWKDDKSQSDAEGLLRVAMACEQISTYRADYPVKLKETREDKGNE